MPISSSGAGAVRGGRSRTRLTPRRVGGIVVAVLAVILLIVALIVAAMNS